MTTGTRRRFDRDQVVTAALALLDEGGPAALSVRRVAGSLGVLPNALYTYVADRQALEALVVERVLAEADVTLLDGGAGAWRDRVAGFAGSLRTVLLAHPGAAGLLTTVPLQGPVAVAIGEGLLRAFSDAGLDTDGSARAAYAAIVHVLGSVVLEVAETDGTAPVPPEADRIAGRAEAFGYLDPAAAPLSAAAAPTMATWIGTEQFTWGLDTLLDGVAARSGRVD